MPLPETEIVALLDQLGVVGVRAVSPVSGGTDTEVWRVTHGDGLVSALRTFREDQALSAAFERIAMAAAREAIPVPDLRAGGTWLGRPVSLIEWCAGMSLGAALFESPSRAWEFGELLGQTQATLHQLTAPAGLDDFGEQWSRRAGTSLPEGTRREQLLHGDFHPMNVLVDNDAISGVIDWTNAGSGDPRLDAARTVVIMSAATLPDTELGYEEMEELRSQLIEGWQAGYESIAGPLEGFDPFLVWAATVTMRDLAHKPPGLSGIALMIERIRMLRAVWAGEVTEDEEEFEGL
jgi:aminoglycoside phosphotransferase (APT) family kinase protein